MRLAEAPFRNAPLLTLEELTARLEEFYRAVDEFNAGWYFESHETLEDLWMVTPYPERQFFQGIIQLAAAFVHLARREYPGIFKLLDASEEKLREFAPAMFGVDVDGVLEGIARVRREFEVLGPDRFTEWNESKRPRISYAREE